MKQSAFSTFLFGISIVLAIGYFIWLIFQNTLSFETVANQDALVKFSTTWHPLVKVFASALTYIASTYLLSGIIQGHKIPEHQKLPLFAYSMLYFLYIDPSESAVEASVGVLFLLMGIHQLFTIHQQNSIQLPVFVAALCFGLAPLFSFYLILYAVLPFVALLFFRPFNFKEQLICLVGVLLPIYYYYGLSFVFEHQVPTVWWNNQFPSLSLFHQNPYRISSIFLFAVLLLISISATLKSQSKLIVRNRNQITVLFSFFVLSLVQIILFSDSLLSLLLMVLSSSVFYPWLVKRAKKTWLSSLPLLLIILLEISSQFIG